MWVGRRGESMPARTAATIVATTEASPAPVRETENSTSPSGPTWMRICVGECFEGGMVFVGDGWMDGWTVKGKGLGK